MNPRSRYDDLPASGAWPGGARYGYTRRRVFINRPWSAAHVTLAEQLGIKLPFVDYQYRETWWNLPLDHWVDVPELGPTYWIENGALVAVTPHLRLHHAKKYANVWWEKPDPLAHVITTVKQAIIEEGLS